jgi:hypothetical protein
MLRTEFAYDVRHGARVHMQILRAQQGMLLLDPSVGLVVFF